MSDSNEISQCGICGIRGPLSEVTNHFLKEHIDAHNEEERINEVEPNGEDTRWTPENVLLLIRLVEKYEEDFNHGIKRKVRSKIANEINKIGGQYFTFEQVDSKWKGLKKTYKKIKEHNKKSRNAVKRWVFYNAMDGFMCRRPEIEPVATCSSVSPSVNVSSLDVLNSTQKKSVTEANTKEIPSTSKTKRKESPGEKRHKEKLKRYDKFLKIFQLSVENQIGRKIDSDDED